jgi:hypothetical protein
MPHAASASASQYSRAIGLHMADEIHDTEMMIVKIHEVAKVESSSVSAAQSAALM